MVKKTTYIAPVTNAGGVRTFTPSTAQILGKSPNPCVPPGPGRAYTPLDGGLPLHLTASSTFSSGSGGGVNAVSLKNPMGRAMEILEIKWQVSLDTSTNPLTSGDGTGVLGGSMACKLQLGELPLTNGFVPVWSFGRSDLISPEVCVDNFNSREYSEYNWRLSRPLYVPAGAVVLPTFQHRGLLASDITVTISYSARDLPDGYTPPSKEAVPYASSYITKSFLLTAAGTDVSNETDLSNPFEETLILQRMTGRVPVISSAVPGFAYENDAASVPGAQMNIRIVDSYGRPIIRDFAPMRQAFSQVTRSWEMDGQSINMEPKSFYRAYIRFDAPINTIVSSAVLYGQGHVGLVGYREVKP